MTLNEFNTLAPLSAAALITECCAAQRWVIELVNKRPFSDNVEFLDFARMVWQTMEEPDFLEAFLAHPQIGDVNSLREKFINTKVLASNEQSLVSQASEATIADLAQANTAYLKKFGFIFIICATGKSAAKMLNLLQMRLGNTRDQELAIAAEEQFKITLIRLNNLFEIN